jgi:peptidyl-prolyl cis-trans isomerase SurA
VRPETLQAGIKAEMVWGSLVRGRYKESLQVGEKDVAAPCAAARNLEVEAFEYKMQPVVLIVPRGSPPAASNSARRKPRRCANACRAARRPILLQVDAERRHPRHRHQDIGRLPNPLRDMLDKTRSAI